MFLKFSIFAVVVIILGTASYIFVSNNLVPQKGQVVISDRDLQASAVTGSADTSVLDESAQGELEAVRVQGPAGKLSSRTMGDLSTVTTTVDGYGNSTTTRFFRSDPKLRMVLLRTAANGSKKAYVYAHMGGVKTFTGDDADFVMTATASDIARKAEIFETRLDKFRQKPKLARKRRQLEPLDSSEIKMNPMDGQAQGVSEKSGVESDG